jgi:ribosome maturation factor RimP
MEGPSGPFVIIKTMSVRNILDEILPELLNENSLELIELNVPAEHRIEIFVDGESNVSIEQCAALMRELRGRTADALDSFQITISSPGLDKPLRHPLQFKKALNKSIEVLMNNGEKHQGVLTDYAQDLLKINLFRPSKSKSGAKPPLSETTLELPISEIKKVRKLIFFS